MEFALVWPNIMGIHTPDVDQNVFLIRIVRVIRPAFEANVLILVLAHVAKMLYAMFSIIFQCVVVLLVLLAMHSSFVDQYLSKVSIQFFSFIVHYWFALRILLISDANLIEF